MENAHNHLFYCNFTSRGFEVEQVKIVKIYDENRTAIEYVTGKLEKKQVVVEPYKLFNKNQIEYSIELLSKHLKN